MQAFGNVASDVIAAQPNAIGKDHVLLDKDRDAGGAAAHVDAGSTQFLFILDQRGYARDIGR